MGKGWVLLALYPYKIDGENDNCISSSVLLLNTSTAMHIAIGIMVCTFFMAARLELEQFKYGSL